MPMHFNFAVKQVYRRLKARETRVREPMALECASKTPLYLHVNNSHYAVPADLNVVDCIA